MNPNLYYWRALEGRDERTIETDVCIYGGNAAGVVAALQLAREGKSTLVLEPGGHLGGLTAGGLSLTDWGKKDAVGGIAREFYRALGAHYGVDEEWRFEPHVAEGVLSRWVEENGIPVHFRQFLSSIEMDGKRITSLTTESGLKVRAKYFLDCSYEGDLMARAVCSHHIGRESNTDYDETLNGVQVHPKHQFEFPVDPYVIEGDAASGLLPGIDPTGLLPIGSGDHRIQAYNFRLCLTRKEENRIPWGKPDDYDARNYELLVRYLAAGGVEETYGKYDKLRGEKVDKNNHGAVSTDFIGQNWEYPRADYATREKIFQAHVNWQRGLFWFLSSDERVPQDAREWVNGWGLCRDEFVETGGWSHQLYIRESRRLVSDYVATENDCLRRRAPEDSVGLGAYQMDSHNCRRFVQIENGAARVLNEGDVQVPPTGPYPISYRSIIPHAGECENLAVPVCMAASHIAYGSIRMEPVFMILGQSAALSVALALDEKSTPLQSVSYARLRPLLEKAGQVLASKP
jgi:hypothetical protein